jgi:DNA polymerase III subunit delta'
MALQEVLGQEHAIRLLSNVLAQGRLAHAYLLAGPAGVGKHFAARQFAKALYCSAPSLSGGYDACDACTACHKIDTENHPDVVEMGPEGSTIRIEHIRTLQHRLSYKPYEDQRMTIILDSCERLTLPATNALLKTLEEPPVHALLLLLTSNKTALPLTITSRCQLIPFRALTPVHLCTILEQQGVEAETAAMTARLSQGGLGEYGGLSEALAVRQCAHTLLIEVVHDRATTVFTQARQLAGKREQCEALLQWTGLLCRDLVMLHVAPNRPLYNDDLRAELSPLAHQLSIDALLDASVLISQLQQFLGMNLNPQLVFERFVIRLQQLAASSTP